MTDEYKLKIQKWRGKRAKQIMEDDLVKEAFAKIKQSIISTWESSDIRDLEGQKNCRLSLRLFENLKTQFEQIIRTGEAAEKALTETKDPHKITRIARRFGTR